MYSSRLPAPAIGDMAHQPSCFLFPQRDFGKMSVVKRSFNRQWPQFSNMATVQWHGHSSVAWPQLTELEIDGRKQFVTTNETWPLRVVMMHCAPVLSV